MAPRVVIVTPAYNESEKIDLLAGSVLDQTQRPTAWVIVDDESSDSTLEAAKRVAKNHGWVTVVQRKKEPGAYDGSFRAFLFGVNSLKLEWDYLMKLDADTTLPTNHLKQLASKFESDQTLGIASGVCLGEPGVRSHPRGNNRMYRRECWKEIRFPEDGWGWDTVDEVFARLNGWKAEAFDEIVCKHLRTKLPDAKYRFHQGRLSRHLGYYRWFLLGRCAKMLLSSGPLPSIYYLAGCVRGGLGPVDAKVRQAIRTDQRRRVATVMGLMVEAPARSTVYAPSFDDRDPLITVAMPTLNRAKYLPTVLDKLHKCSYPHNRLRLVFVDGYSTDGTFDLLRDFAQVRRKEYKEIVLLQEKCNIPQARNVCINNIGPADLLLFVDSDIIVTPDFISKLIGLSKVGDIASIFYSSFSYQRPKPAVKYVQTVGMGCTLIRRDVLTKVGLFDTSLPVNEDTDYCLRAGKLGYRVVQDTVTQLLHEEEGRYSAEQTIRQSFRYRRVYAKLFTMGIYRWRFLLYGLLDLSLAFGFIFHPIFFVAPLAYLAVQFVRRRKVRLPIFLVINSLIILPLAFIGLIERRFSDRSLS